MGAACSRHGDKTTYEAALKTTTHLETRFRNHVLQTQHLIETDQLFTSAQHLFSLITIGLHVSTVIQSSSGPS